MLHEGLKCARTGFLANNSVNVDTGEPGEMEYCNAQMHCISLPYIYQPSILGSYLQLTDIVHLGYTTNLRLAGFLNHQEYQPILTKTTCKLNLPPLIRFKNNTSLKIDGNC